MSKILGVAESAVSMWELGRRRPDYETLEAIADYFNVDMNYLLGKSDIQNQYRLAIKSKNGPAVYLDRPLHEIDKKELLQFALWGGADGMDDDDLKAVLDYAEFLKQRKNR